MMKSKKQGPKQIINSSDCGRKSPLHTDFLQEHMEDEPGSCEHLGTNILLSMDDGDSDMEFGIGSAGLKPMHMDMDIERPSAFKKPVISSVMVSHKVTPMAKGEL